MMQTVRDIGGSVHLSGLVLRADELEISGLVGKGIPVLCGAAEGHPAVAELGRAEVVLESEIAEGELVTALYALVADDHGHGLSGREDDGPLVLGPGNGEHVGLASDILEVVTIRTVSEEHCPPLSVAVLHKVGVTGAGNGIGTCRIKSHLGKDGIALIRDERSEGRLALENDLRVPLTEVGATLGAHQVILAVDLVDMRTFDPIGIVLGTGTLVDDDLALPYGAVIRDVELDAADGTVAVVLGLVVRSVVVADDIGLAVVIEEE